MARKKAEAVQAVMGDPPRGLPVQDRGVDVWPILTDPAQCAREIEAGAHDAHLDILEHVSKSQAITPVYAAAIARRCLLTGT